MSELSENAKYKWTSDGTTLLVSVWTDRQVQQQLEHSRKPQLIWESISKYMQKKGYEVTAKQCRSRMKQVLVCYKEAKKSGTHAGVERYYGSIDKVLESKRLGRTKLCEKGIDTVDSVSILSKSPLKEIKTNENLHMRRTQQEEMPISLDRHIEVVPGTWQSDREDYGDSSESNETVLARPHNTLSSMKNIGTNTVDRATRLYDNPVQRSSANINRFQNENVENNRFAEIPLQSGVQNVHNQIIQENMMLRNRLARDDIGQHRRTTDHPIGVNHSSLRINLHPENIIFHPTRVATNMVRMQSQLQQYSLDRNMVAESKPRKSINMRENTAMNDDANTYQQAFTQIHPPDIAPNLNDSFCPTTKNMKLHNLNETYDRPIFIDDENSCPVDTTTITNNATFNDDTLSIDFIEGSLSPTENGAMESSNTHYNRIISPNPPVRKKKAQKLEQLMLNAITSQTEVFNKILATQDVMISRILDIDKDHHNRLENRLDQLMNVVQEKMLDKNEDKKESNFEIPISPIPLQNNPVCFSPPPKPGTIPPKLDLVPPKPCRVPCTNPSTHIELVTRNSLPLQSVNMPTKPGTIWTKLGPVSQSPFMKAQKQISAVTKAAEQWRTRSSAERRIAHAPDSITDPKKVIEETKKFLQTEKLIEERIENARRLSSDPERNQHARRKLFEPAQLSQNIHSHVSYKQTSDAGLLSAAFLDIERKSEEKLRISTFPYNSDKMGDYGDLLTVQGESYSHFQRQSNNLQREKDFANLTHENEMNTSTPAKFKHQTDIHVREYDAEPRQTIQKLTELVMNSARWPNDATSVSNRQPHRPSQLSSNDKQYIIPTRPLCESEAQKLSRNKTLDWLQDPYSCNAGIPEYKHLIQKPRNHAMGFTRDYINVPQYTVDKQTADCPIGFTADFRQQFKFQGDQELQSKVNEMNQYKSTYGRGTPTVHYNSDGKSELDRPNPRMGSRANDDIDDDEFLDATTTLHPHRKPSITSMGNENTKFGTTCLLS